MVYIIDIDGTICSLTEGDYDDVVPFYDKIKVFNRLYDSGHTIIYWTARGMGPMMALPYTIWLFTMDKLGYTITTVDYIFMVLIYMINLATFAVKVSLLNESPRGKNQTLNTFSFDSRKKVK